jgi:hypothetical protein
MEIRKKLLSRALSHSYQEQAFDESQKYKEGKSILEKELLKKKYWTL